MADITFFQTTNEEGETVLKPRPQCESIETLKQMIADGRPQKAIGLFVGYVANGMNWKYYDDWKAKQDAYEKEYAIVTDYNANPDLDENDQPTLKEYPTEPEPLNFVEVTEDDVISSIQPILDDIALSKNKLNAFEFNGVICSATEADQNGWGALTVLIDNAINAGVPFTTIPFNNENGNVVEITSREEWTEFLLIATQARQEFFQ